MAIGSKSRVVIVTILALVTALMAGSFGVMAQCVTSMAITKTGTLIIGQAVTIKWEITVQASSSVAFAGTLTRCVKSPSWTSVPCNVLTGGVETSGEANPFEVEYLFSPSEAGDYRVTGSYEGCTTCDPELNSSSSSITSTVSKASTATSVASNLNPSTTADTVTFIATVTFSADKPVTWITGPTRDVESNGTASVEASFDATNSPIVITATYNEAGDDNYATSYGTLSQTVLPSLAATTTTVTSASPALITASNVSVTFTARIAGSGTPTGTVNFYKDGTILIGSYNLETDAPDDEAEISYDFDSVGLFPITATYTGNDHYESSTSTVLDQQVRANTTTTIVSDIPGSSVLGQSYLVTGTVSGVQNGSGNPTGTVTVSDCVASPNTNSCIADVDPDTGAWSCSINASGTSTGTGACNLTATYSGDSNFNASSDMEDHTYTYTDPATRTEVMGAATPLIVNNTATFEVYVVNVLDPSTFPQGSVEVSVDPSGEETLSASSCNLDAAGRCTFTYTPTSAADTPHVITAEYLGEPGGVLRGPIARMTQASAHSLKRSRSALPI